MVVSCFMRRILADIVWSVINRSKIVTFLSSLSTGFLNLI